MARSEQDDVRGRPSEIPEAVYQRDFGSDISRAAADSRRRYLVDSLWAGVAGFFFGFYGRVILVAGVVVAILLLGRL